MTILGGQELVLLVDDELAIVKIMEKFLKKLNYRVISTSNSIRAWHLFQQKGKDIQLVITDLTMPDMSGIDLIASIRTIQPEIPIILCTGYGEITGKKHMQQFNLTACLGKPVTQTELASALKRVFGYKLEKCENYY